MKTKIICLLLMLIFFQSFASAAEKTSVDWVRLESDNGEFSIEMPAGFSYFFDADGFSYNEVLGSKTYQFTQMQLLNGKADKTVMSIEIYKVPAPKAYLDKLLDYQKFSGNKRDDSQPGFTIKTFEQNKFKSIGDGKNIEISHITKLIASKTYLYSITVANRGAKTPEFQRFLASMQLNAAPVQPANNNSSFVKISSLKPLTVNDVFEDASGNVSKPKTSPQNSPNPTVTANSFPVMILTKPRPAYTDSARNSMISGTVRFRIKVANNGQISKVGIVEGLHNGLNRSAFFCALRIKFIPQERDGTHETVTKTIEYSFQVGWQTLI